MPRQARIDAAGVLHHVIARGIERKPIFRYREDKKDFLDRLSLLVTETRHAIYAWAILTNHVHLLVRTGDVRLSKLMARLLTGYASSYNRRHRRVGHLFQNRYKSIICQEEPYLRELVRYIHLNPLRAALVQDYDGLCHYPWSGHSAILGTTHRPWQDTTSILSLFGYDPDRSIRAYQDFVLSGIPLGRRPELTGGGLVRSLGGWETPGRIKNIEPVKGDQRILGDTAFVTEILERVRQKVTEQYEAGISGMSISTIEMKICGLRGVAKEGLHMRGRKQEVVAARSIICFLAVELLATPLKELALRYKITEPAISYLLKKGRKLVHNNELEFFKF